ncbi:MFS transporter [Streptomyces sp. NPDC085944]|uniref:MFS transporter n=1 Tax=Streptomyces sp. NPDC085944 TaxID=3154962 RepID=UPI00342F198E
MPRAPTPSSGHGAVALWAVGGAIASAADPVAGGAASLVSRRMIFFINLPAGLIALAMVPAATPTRAPALPMLPVGMGGPPAMPPTTALLVDSVPPHHTGTASGVFNASRRLGGGLAVAV